MSELMRLREAIDLARASVKRGGGPFGALVLRAGEVVGRGENRVVRDGDPTAHAEIVALREAAAKLGTHVLAGCELYASCEPCAMCFGAAHWARIERIHYSCTHLDAAAAGFDDALLYEELTRPPAQRRMPVLQALRDEGLAAFEDWRAHPERATY